MAVTCEICNKRLRTRYNLRIHMVVHTGEKPYTCDVCNKGFQQRWNLVTHVSRVHAGHKPFTCSDCHRSFGYKSHFKAHIKFHFLAQLQVPPPIKERLLRPYPCGDCERSFETLRLLKQHLRAHTGERPFICDACGKSFATRKSIAGHVQRKCAGAYNTKVVPKAKQRLRDPTPCEICGKIVARYSLHKHLNIHTRKRVYPCRVCGKEFLEAGQRIVHERTHSGRKPHICDVCGKAFAQLGNLYVHRRRYHHITENLPKVKAKAVDLQVENKLNDLNRASSGLFNNLANNIPVIYDSQVSTQSLQNTPQQNVCNLIAEKYPVNDNIPCEAECHKIIDIQQKGEDSLLERASENIANPVFTFDPEESSQTNVSNDTNEATAPSNDNLVTGCHTIRDFCDMAAQWITTRAIDESDDKQQIANEAKKSEKANDTSELVKNAPDDEVINQDWKKEAKKEVWNKLMSEIGNLEAVKATLLKIEGGKEDNTMRLLRELPQLPPNSVVTRNGMSNFHWHCWDCKAQMSSRHLLVRHRLRHKPAHLRPHRCTLCSRTFTQSGNLQHHMLVHRGEHRFTCEHCGALFRHKSHLTTHRHQHSDSIPAPRFHCATCGKTANSRFHLIQHIRTHTQERPYQCQTCGKQFAASSTHDRHMKTHEASTEKCLVCGQTFSDRSSLQRHQITHDVRRRHSCVCGRSFTQMSSLRRHAPICTQASGPPAKLFQCAACQKAFIDAPGLKRHAMTHDATRAFSCRYCSLQLKTQETLKRHVRRQHQTSLLASRVS